MRFALVVVALALLLALNVPIAFAIGVAALIYMLLGKISLLVLAQQIANGPDSWILLAMPLFILAGLLMNATGITDRLVRFAAALVGQFRGGLGLVNVVTNMLMGGISGSAVADTAAIGSVLIPAMEKEGYPKDFTAALTSSAGSIGIIIPPSIPMILYGAIAGVSVGTLFIAGILPGILVGVGQMAIVYRLARRAGWGIRIPFSGRSLLRATGGAALALLMPVIIVGGIMGGVFTPTEAGAVAVVYGTAVALLVFRSLRLHDLYRVLVDAGILTSIVMIVVATSYTLGWVLSAEEIPQAITAWFTDLSRNPVVVLGLFMLLLILLGCFLHGDPIMLIVVPMLLPTVRAVGVDLVHFGMLVTFSIAIGQQTPPVGSTLFVVSALSGLDIMRVTRANLPFIALFIGLTYCLILFPQVTLALPRWLGLR